MYPESRTASLMRLEKHKKSKDKYSYWTYKEEQEYYTTNTMYNNIGKTLLKRS